YSSISAVSFPCTPSTSVTGLPRAAEDSTSMPRRRSDFVRLATPLEPWGHTIPCAPQRSTKAASRARSSQSTSPLAVNGVVRIMNAPRIALTGAAIAADALRGPTASAASVASPARPNSRRLSMAIDYGRHVHDGQARPHHGEDKQSAGGLNE